MRFIHGHDSVIRRAIVHADRNLARRIDRWFERCGLSAELAAVRSEPIGPRPVDSRLFTLCNAALMASARGKPAGTARHRSKLRGFLSQEWRTPRTGRDFARFVFDLGRVLSKRGIDVVPSHRTGPHSLSRAHRNAIAVGMAAMQGPDDSRGGLPPATMRTLSNLGLVAEVPGTSGARYELTPEGTATVLHRAAHTTDEIGGRWIPSWAATAALCERYNLRPDGPIVRHGDEIDSRSSPLARYSGLRFWGVTPAGTHVTTHEATPATWFPRRYGSARMMRQLKHLRVLKAQAYVRDGLVAEDVCPEPGWSDARRSDPCTPCPGVRLVGKGVEVRAPASSPYCMLIVEKGRSDNDLPEVRLYPNTHLGLVHAADHAARHLLRRS